MLLAYVFHLYLQGLVWNGENGDDISALWPEAANLPVAA
jgi:hypothetical protein